jgi:hypothetical protein
VLIGAHFGFIGASFVLIQLSFALVPAWLGSFGLIWAHLHSPASRLCLY